MNVVVAPYLSHWKERPGRMQPSARRHGVFLAWKLIGTLLRSFGRVLIEGVKYYADQPRMLGKTFLRLVSLLVIYRSIYFKVFIQFYISIIRCFRKGISTNMWPTVGTNRRPRSSSRWTMRYENTLRLVTRLYTRWIIFVTYSYDNYYHVY